MFKITITTVKHPVIGFSDLFHDTTGVVSHSREDAVVFLCGLEVVVALDMTEVVLNQYFRPF
jgi:hypothetical protein